MAGKVEVTTTVDTTPFGKVVADEEVVTIFEDGGLLGELLGGGGGGEVLLLLFEGHIVVKSVLNDVLSISVTVVVDVVIVVTTPGTVVVVNTGVLDAHALPDDETHASETVSVSVAAGKVDVMV